MEINEKVLELKVEEQKLQEELAHWESFTPSGNMGKWGRQVRLDKITEKLKKSSQKH